MREGWERLRRWGGGLVWGSHGFGGIGERSVHPCVCVVAGWCLLLWKAEGSGGWKWDWIWLGANEIFW